MFDGDTPQQIGGLAAILLVAAVAAAKGIDWLMRAAERFGFVRTPSAWKLEAEALVQRVDELAGELAAVKAELASVKAENAELRARPDLTAVVAMLERQEERADEFSRTVCAAITRLADHVGAA